MSIELMNRFAHFFSKHLGLWALLIPVGVIFFGHTRMNAGFIQNHMFIVNFFPTFVFACVAWAVHTMLNIERK